jgi:hypothetical protein
MVIKKVIGNDGIMEQKDKKFFKKWYLLKPSKNSNLKTSYRAKTSSHTSIGVIDKNVSDKRRWWSVQLD